MPLDGLPRGVTAEPMFEAEAIRLREILLARAGVLPKPAPPAMTGTPASWAATIERRAPGRWIGTEQLSPTATTGRRAR